MNPYALAVIQHADAGVHQVIWCPDGGRPDAFFVVRVEYADPRWLSLADVLVTRARPTVADAADLAAATLRRATGCGLVAVPVRSDGHLLRARSGGQILLRPDSADIVRWAAFGYAVLASGGALTLRRRP